MTYSDFETTEFIQDEEGNDVSKATKKEKVRKKGAFINIYKMATHTKIVPQERLYSYLADRSMEIDDEELVFS